MIVAKFGGKSVANASNIKTICRITKQEIKKHPVIVVSAVSQVTNMLLALAVADSNDFNNIFRQIENAHFNLISDLWGKKTPENVKMYIASSLDSIKTIAGKIDKTKAEMDRLLMHGEMMSSYIVACALSLSGIKSEQVSAMDLIVTDEEFGSAEFIPQLTVKKTKKTIEPLLKKGIVPVITGFIGATEKGEPTTIGRGGSDYSASIIGYSLGAKEIQIWTDVDGLFTADPRIVQTAKPLSEVSFKEASELAAFGAKVLHSRTMRPAIKANIPVKILNTLNPKSPGTKIKVDTSFSSRIAAITSKKKIVLINLYSTEMLLSKGFLARIFAVFEKNNISIDLVSVSEVSVSVTLDNDENLNNALAVLSKFTSVAKISDFGIVSLVGEGIVKIPHVMKKIFTILDKQKIFVKMISLGATDINISLVIESSKVEKTVRSLHDGLIKL